MKRHGTRATGQEQHKKSVTGKQCDMKKVQHEKSATLEKRTLEIAKHGKSATRKRV